MNDKSVFMLHVRCSINNGQKYGFPLERSAAQHIFISPERTGEGKIDWN